VPVQTGKRGGEKFSPAGQAARLSGFFPRTVRARVFAAVPVSWQLQFFRRHAREFDTFGLAHGFPGEAAGGEKLHGKSAQQQMFAFDLPALGLQVRVDGRDASGQTFVGGDEKNVCVVGGEWFDVINRRQRAAECLVLNQLRGDQTVHRSQHISQRDV
jgi:hypothetical protein